MNLEPGTSLGPYEIIALIGAGGMGQVYKARDTRLDRTVAVKIASEGFTERFDREARAVAALNHPNICQLYDVGPNYLVMEFVEGEPLQGPLPVEKAVAYANQILDALAAAHKKGIIHRDLKPANILVTRLGVKLLDFGLARLESPLKTSGDSTVTAALTGNNQIVGTLQYMSPEQLQMEAADARSDLFAFGCVLYEMLTGRRAFQGNSAASVIGSILHREPDPLEIAPPLDRVIRRCLAKDPDHRFQSARDLQYNLALAMESAAPPVLKTAAGSKLPWIAAAVLALVAVAALWAPWRAAPAPRPLIRVSDELPSGYQLVNPPFGSRMFALSPDGARLAASLRGPDRKVHIHTRLLNESAWKILDGTEGGLFPFFSPDGAWIGFLAENKLRKIPAAGGAPVELAEQTNNGFRGASWASDGNIYFSAITEGLRRIAASGGPIERPGKPGSGPIRGFWPQVLPGGKAVLFTEAGFNLDDSKINVLPLDTGEIKTVQTGAYSALYLAAPNGAGRLVYMHETSILTAPFSLSRLTTEGAPHTLVDGVASGFARGGDFAASNTGLIAYAAGKAERRSPTTISWLDRSGKVSPLYSVPALYANPRLSPDGKRIAYTVSTAASSDLWVKDLDRDTPTRLTVPTGRSDQERPDWAIWTPDSKSILFSGANVSGGDLYWVDADGSGPAEVVARGLFVLQGLATFSGGSKELVFSTIKGSRQFEIAMAAIEGEKGHRKLGAIQPFLSTPFDHRHPAISPDGKWIAYDSLEAGAVEVYVRPFPGPGGKWRISNGGGMHPIWFRNSRELLYHNPSTSRAMVVSYAVNGSEFKPGKPELWSEMPLQGNPVYHFYDLAPDGKRLAVVGLNDEVAPGRPATGIRFLINWPGELNARP